MSYEFVQKKFGLDPEVQSSKVEQEWKERNKKNRVEKAGPFHRGGFDQEIKKSLIDVAPPTSIPGSPKKVSKPVKKAGRPNQAKDGVPRKQRRFVPLTKATEFWLVQAQDKVGEFANPIILGEYQKKNMRSLTAEQTDSAEKMKFSILFNLTPNAGVTHESVVKAALLPFPAKEYGQFTKYRQEVSEALGRDLTFAEQHSIQREVYLNGKI